MPAIGWRLAQNAETRLTFGSLNGRSTLDFSPNPDHQLIRDAVRSLCANFDDAYWRACDQEHRFPWEFYDAMAKGFTRCSTV